ncbi:uncharacterized protein PHACADRAFT_256969 [Phanerochaete carnosa HHB-10118-sp]|uniref:Carboxylesterase type B domain-containing protein n=1 Tax=Phanerochaete carnosa (strain HHB-10118-sp) TaxID=650164 RepID=K5WZN6_PHACS|nr:uncharacterized protein PHACADRAFT_256969 [Phanerochaete carnosa HHB-10118-sp]EKM55972.1 hypothetical protein PHACADRAFT_256969 [Phanerochaete carnosa HHB-10118-sp]
MLPSLRFTFILLGGHTLLASAIPAPRSPPSVTLDQGTFIGAPDGVTNMFLGMPFAQPPIGDLRFSLPVPNDPYNDTYDATSFGLACPQQVAPPPQQPFPSSIINNVTELLLETFGNTSTPSGEDCLNLNVWTPANITTGTQLPVVVWIFGGGFEADSPNSYDGSVIVSRSVEMNQPVVYVSINYRNTAFGFLASQEVKDAGVGNLGLRDQRQALRWVQKYISAFNGDPSRVTIWGASAGAISVSLQMLTNGGDTEGLFHGAFMESGSPIPVGDITHGQKYYDALVSETGCSGAADTLQCLREVPFDALMAAVNQSPSIDSLQSLDLAWMPRADGAFLPYGPQALVTQGSVASIPFVTGDVDDEGTAFSLYSLNVTTDDEVREYLTTYYLPDTASSQVDALMEVYPQDPAQGSPFDTGDLNQLSPQFKRLAAIQGDMVFQAPRRFFLANRSDKQTTYAFLSKRYKSLPGVGSMHGTDILNVYFDGDMTDYLVNFVNNLDPNGPGLLSWPTYSTSSPQLLTFLDGPVPLNITEDTFRADGMSLLTELMLANPI